MLDVVQGENSKSLQKKPSMTNQQQNQPTHDAESGIPTQVTLVTGDCSHHSAVESSYDEVPRDWKNVLVISGFFSIHFTITGLKDTVRYARVFVK